MLLPPFTDLQITTFYSYFSTKTYVVGIQKNRLISPTASVKTIGEENNYNLR